MLHIAEKKTGETHRRWQVAILDKNFDRIRTCRWPRPGQSTSTKTLPTQRCGCSNLLAPGLQWPRSPDLSGVANDRFV